MIIAYKEHSQFILILAIMYVAGVWGGPIIYPMFPLVLFLFGLRERYFELLITALWILILADYVPVKDATYDDLQFAKDLKFMVPLFLVGFFMLRRDNFKPYPKLFLWFIPFLICSIIALQFSLDLKVGVEKTISYILILLAVPFYTSILHREQGEFFWKSLITFIIGMLSIGIVLRFVAPDIAMLEGGRFKGILGNPNGLGIFLNLTLILWIITKEYGLATYTRKENWYIIIVIIVSLLWSGSRNGMMSMLIFLLMFNLIKINWFLAILVLIFVLTFGEQIFDVFIAIVEFFNLEAYFRIESIEAGSGRKVAWVFAFQEIQNYYFIGGGFGHDESIMRPNYFWLSQLGHQGGVHNSYLSMWFDVGIVGLILYFGAFWANLFRAMRYNYIALAFGVSIMFNITYESWLVASLNPFGILFLIILTVLVGNYTKEDYDVIVKPSND